MRRLFLRTYVGLCVTYVIAMLAGTRLLYRAPLAASAAMYEGAYGGGVSLALERIAAAPPERRPSVLDDVSARFGFPVRVFEWGSGDVDARARADLAGGGRLAVWYSTARGEGTYLAAPLARGVSVVRFGPLPGSTPPTYGRWGEVVAAVGAILALGAFVLLRPIGRQFRALEGAAERLHRGDLSARADEAGASTRPIARAFNAMADDLLRRVDAQRELLRTVSHELRTPLARVRFAIDRLAGTDSAGARAEQLDAIDEDLAELDGLVGELLTIARLDHDGGAPALEPVSVRGLLRELEGEFPGLECDGAPEGLVVPGDPRLLRRALGNVVRNAFAHAKGRVRAGASRAGSRVRVAIEDDGPGVPSGDRERVFEPFVRLSPERRGAGLGLAIVRRVVERHGGATWIEGAPIGGCLWVVELPAGEAGRERRGPGAGRYTPLPSGPRLCPRRGLSRPRTEFQTMSKLIVWPALVFVMAAVAACDPSGDSPPAPSAQRDAATTLLLDQGLVGKPFGDGAAVARYGAAVGAPSPYLTDYYGLHVMRPVAKDVVLRDLVPRAAALVEDRGNSATLSLAGGHKVVFHFGKDLVTPDGAVVDSGHDYALFDGPDVDGLLAALGAFHDALEGQGLSDVYLIRNHHHGLEIAVTAEAAASAERVAMTPDPGLALFRAAGPDAVLAVPDAVHGDEARYAEILDVVQNEQFDWFAIEMYERGAQPAVEAFLSEPEGSPAFAEARRALLDASWKKFAADTPDDNHYFRLLEACRRRKIRVYGIDIDRLYTLWGHGEVPFGGMVRNSFWADGLPESGRGVIFGGSAHFRGDALVGGRPPLFVQDFLAPVYRGEKLLALPAR